MITLYLFVALLLVFVSGLYSNIVKKPALYVFKQKKFFNIRRYLYRTNNSLRNFHIAFSNQKLKLVRLREPPLKPVTPNIFKRFQKTNQTAEIK